jgi:anti-anti-sigma factor
MIAAAASTGDLDAEDALLEVHVESSPGGPITLFAHGELDLFTRPVLGRELALAQRSGRAVVLDLRGLDFMDCGGLSLLMEAKARGPLRILTPRSGAARMLLDATGAMLEAG